MVSYSLFLFIIKKNGNLYPRSKLHARENDEFHVIPRFQRDHLRSTSGPICGPIWGSFPVWGSFAALYTTFYGNMLNSKKYVLPRLQKKNFEKINRLDVKFLSTVIYI